MSSSGRGPGTGGEGPGAFVLSVDLELLWGVCDRPDWRDYVPVIRAAREAVPRLLDLLDEHGIPATWAVVGHLLVDCDEECEALARRRRTADGMVPCQAGLPEKLWRLEKLAGWMTGAGVDHDVGGHGFWHLELGTENVFRPGQVDRELARSHASVAEAFEAPVSFVYPRNRLARADQVRQAGFEIVRAPNARWYETDRPGPLTRALRFADEALRLRPPAARFDPSDAGGLARVSASQHFRPLRGGWRWIPPRSRLGRARKGLRAASREGGRFHLWLHPHDLVDADGAVGRSLELLGEILTSVARAREAGRIEVRTMRDLGTGA